MPPLCKVVKYYAVFKVQLDLPKLKSLTRHLYQFSEEDNELIAAANNIIYVFHPDRVEVCDTNTKIVDSAEDFTRVFDLEPARRRIMKATQTFCGYGIVSRVVSSTLVPLSELNRMTLHYRLAETKPPNLELNIFEPVLSPDLLLKFSDVTKLNAIKLSTTFHVHATLHATIVHDLSMCPQPNAEYLEYLKAVSDYVALLRSLT